MTSSDHHQGNNADSSLSQPSGGPYARRPFPAGNFPAEADISSVVQTFTDNWNRSDVTAIRSLWCSGRAPDATILSKQIGWYGRIQTSVSRIGGAGDEASAAVVVTTSHGGETEDWWFVNEGGHWKPCKSSFIWTQDNGH
ncbi:hypothetical protein [Mycobacterium sp. E183]|uniref:hypothetical protein n=1 Tax=Mycobacterium sp. E183 TaxID=1834129 RepID=UPI0012E8C425|nr:hypothetical protein [Mycobacterium sp. E183]